MVSRCLNQPARKAKSRGRGYQGRDDEALLVGDALPVSQDPVAIAKEQRRLLHLPPRALEEDARERGIQASLSPHKIK